MTDKQKNLIVRSITGVLFVVCMVSCFLNPRAMISSLPSLQDSASGNTADW